MSPVHPAPCGAIVLTATRLRLPWLTNHVLIYLGTISYTLYLLHATIGRIIILRVQKMGLNDNLAVVVGIAGAISLASIVTLLVERPALRAIKARFAPRKSAAPASPPPGFVPLGS